MKFSFFALASLAATTVAATKNILLTNDDGWAATNIRAFYNALKAADYNVLLVASTEQWSGNGGRFIVTSNNTLERDGNFAYPPMGAPAWGYEEDDMNIWYFNGSPAACVSLGLDYIIPNYFPNMSIDLVVGGPNEGTNMGERDTQFSATIGAVNYAIERGYPAIAFSASNSNNSFFKDNLDDVAEHSWNVYADASVEFVNELFEVNSTPLVPLATGFNVNYPIAGTDLGSNCTKFTWRHTRLTGTNALATAIEYNSTTGLFQQYYVTDAANQNCVDGNCDLPLEFTIIGNENCEATITVITIDGDAPEALANEAATLFKPLIGTS